MNAIKVKIVPATGTKGTRVKASNGPAYVLLPYDHELGAYHNAQAAAISLARKLGYTGLIQVTSLNDGAWVGVVLNPIETKSLGV